jgi:hypothetical protein
LEESGGVRVEAEAAPASDRFVSFDHNSAPFKEATNALEQLAEAVRGSNELFADPEERLAVAEEVSSIRHLIARASVRIAAVQQARNGLLKWLVKAAAGAIVGHWALVAMTALGALAAAALSHAL